MKALADYVHDRGLLFGMYADVGSLTCGGYSGLDMDANLSSKQYIQDVATFAEWGVDALKVDGCYEKPEIMNVTYPALSDAINASGHAMWLSCSWPCYVGGCSGGPAKVENKVFSVVQDKCNTARDMNDIYDNIDSLYKIIGAYTNPLAIKAHNSVNGPGYFSDADMLTAGAGGLSLVEETMQMVMWVRSSSFSRSIPFSDLRASRVSIPVPR
jgi:alpha-N-acetylgalactosaminidase